MKRPSLVALVVLAVGPGGPSSAQEPGPAVSAAEGDRVESAASRDGTRIAYEQAGSGPPIVLVSGALCGREGLAPLAGMLSQDFTVVTYDRRGRGASGDTQPYAVLREVEDLEAVIDATGGHACLLGVSSGAVLALEASNELGAKVLGAALFEPPFIVDDTRAPIPPAFFEQVGRLLEEGRRGDAVAAFMSKAVGVPEEQLEAMRRSPMWDGLLALAHTLPYDGELLAGFQGGEPLPRDRWTSVDAPILVLDGEQSPAFLRSSAAALVKVVPGAKRRRLANCDHSAPFLAPEVFVPVVAGLAETARSRSREAERR